jgi:NAD+ synthase (glutamine-hydrolysing)
VEVADCNTNTASIIKLAEELNAKGVDVAVFPEMCLTAYTCADLFHSSTLLSATDKAISDIVAASIKWHTAIVVGAPVYFNNALYNCAIAIADGHILAAIPKTYIPNYNEFYEKRWWTSGQDISANVVIAGQHVAMSTKQLLNIDGVKIGIEICEDLWAPIPPSTHASLAGASIILNLSASNDLIGKYNYLVDLIRQQSARCIAAYVYAGAGYGESSTDLVFDGKAIIAENGCILNSSERWVSTEKYVISDIDIEALAHDRMHTSSYHDCANAESCAPYSTIDVHTRHHTTPNNELFRTIAKHPFVPTSDADIDKRCGEIISIQAAGLARRLEFTHCHSLVVGISGGLDSTLALLIACRAFDWLHIDRKGITAITMPGFGTTDRTYTNAISLMQSLGVSIREISIATAVSQHFTDIGHNPSAHDVTYENSQARERTQILMDVANQVNGMVLGTGDLSELALGWATYNGDHMSMYGVNASIPKTLVRYLVRWFASRSENETERHALLDIIDTPISPELIPADADGNISQKTEDLVGPYELHDFFLYYTLRYGFSPRKIYLLARHAFAGQWADDVIRHWLRTFFRRFFSQQFKRSCLPDGPKVGSVCLSPRGDWRMPSDASAAIWLAECDAL